MRPFAPHGRGREGGAVPDSGFTGTDFRAVRVGERTRDKGAAGIDPKPAEGSGGKNMTAAYMAARKRPTEILYKDIEHITNRA